MDEILQLSPIREGKLQEDLQTMLISNEKKVTIHSKINFSSLGTYKLLYTSDVVRRNAQWNLPPPPLPPPPQLGPHWFLEVWKYFTLNGMTCIEIYNTNERVLHLKWLSCLRSRWIIRDQNFKIIIYIGKGLSNVLNLNYHIYNFKCDIWFNPNHSP